MTSFVRLQEPEDESVSDRADIEAPREGGQSDEPLSPRRSAYLAAKRSRLSGPPAAEKEDLREVEEGRPSESAAPRGRDWREAARGAFDARATPKSSAARRSQITAC